MNPEPVSITAVVNDVGEALRSMAEEKQLRFTIELPAEALVTVTDQRALHQILLNLANNAIKYTHTGSVRMSAARAQNDGGRIQILVQDTGIGIREEDRARLFQAFEQLDTSSTRRFEGAGLGLHLSRRLADLIGATLECQSTFGQGSTMVLSLAGMPP